MKIATWNFERPLSSAKRVIEITKILKGLDADILILTETNDCIDLGDEYSVFHTGYPLR